MNPHTRFVERTVPLTPAEARKRKAGEILRARWDVRRLRSRVEEEIETLRLAVDAPLETEVRRSFALEPGDEGYAEAPVGFNASAYSGDVKWINHSQATHQP